MSIVRFLKAKSEEQIKEAGGYTKVSTYMNDEGVLAFAPEADIYITYDIIDAIQNRVAKLEELVGEKGMKCGWKRKTIGVYNPFEIIEGEIVGIDREF